MTSLEFSEINSELYEMSSLYYGEEELNKSLHLTNMLYDMTGNRKIVRDFDPDEAQVIALCNMVPDIDLRKTINGEFINVFNYCG